MSAAMRSVHAIASSQPPPSAKPLIAAITGFAQVLDRVEHVLTPSRVLSHLCRSLLGQLV